MFENFAYYAEVTYLIAFMTTAMAFWNIVRGGWPHMDPKPWWKKSDYLWWLASMASLCMAFGWAGIPIGTGFWAGMLTGWGVYIGAILNRKNAPDKSKPYFNGGTAQWQSEPQDEVKWIDVIIRPLRKNPLAYGMAGMFFRGLMAGLITTAVTYLTKFGMHLAGHELVVPNMLPIVIGFSMMPLAYWLATVIPGVSQSNAWRTGEGIWGAFIGIGVAVAKIIQLAKKGKNNGSV